MTHAIAKESIQQLFTEARTHHGWLDKPVGDDLLRAIYEMAKWGPTSANCTPARFVFVKSPEAKAKLISTLLGSNVEQVKAAPVTLIVAFDEKFYDQLPMLFPFMDFKPMFAADKALSEVTAMRNSSLQGAYFIFAIRALGLDAGPMSGFDNAKLDEAFFKGTSWKSNFLCNIGYGDTTKLYPRGPRLSFEETCKIV